MAEPHRGPVPYPTALNKPGWPEDYQVFGVLAFGKPPLSKMVENVADPSLITPLVRPFTIEDRQLLSGLTSQQVGESSLKFGDVILNFRCH